MDSRKASGGIRGGKKMKVKMSKKVIVSLIIIITGILMIIDMRYNGVSLFENLFRELETESMREQQVNFNYQNDIKNNPSSDIRVTDRKIVLNEDIKRLNMKNEMGSIKITGEKRDDILLSFILTVYAEEKEQAELFIHELDIINYSREETMIIELKRPEFNKGIKGIKVDYTLVVPEELLLEIKNSFGRLTVKNMIEDIILKNSFDVVDIMNISGDVELAATYGNIFVENISGDLSTKSSFASAEYSRISGSLTANTAFGQLSISDFSNSLQIRGSYSEIDIELSDELSEYSVSSETKYGSINTNLPFQVEAKDNVQTMNGSEGSGSIKINVINEYGNININK